MSEARQELLQGLYYVQNMMANMQNVFAEYVGTQQKFLEREKGIGTTGFKNRSKLLFVTMGVTLTLFYVYIWLLSGYGKGNIVFMAIIGALSFIKKKKSFLKLIARILLVATIVDMLMMVGSDIISIFDLIILIDTMGAACCIVYYYVDIKNKSIFAMNMSIDDYNAGVAVRCRELSNRYNQLQNELWNNTSAWYPPDYYTMAAVSFFIDAVRNSRADSVKEMVNLFETTKYREQMLAYQQQHSMQLDRLISGQQNLQQQMFYNNMMDTAAVNQMSQMNSKLDHIGRSADERNKTLGSIDRTFKKINKKI